VLVAVVAVPKTLLAVLQVRAVVAQADKTLLVVQAEQTQVVEVAVLVALALLSAVLAVLVL
jgi:hypothetical protein